MISSDTYKPWTLKFKPFNIHEMQIESDFRKKFIRMIIQKNVPNLIIYGPPGSGKTSIGKFINFFNF